MRAIFRTLLTLIALAAVGGAVALAFVKPPAPEPRVIERPAELEGLESDR